MTLTAPGCGMADVLKADVERKLARLPGVKEVIVEVVFDPPWEPGRMTEAAKLRSASTWISATPIAHPFVILPICKSRRQAKHDPGATWSAFQSQRPAAAGGPLREPY